MSNDQAVFSFELNESLYFERGQEVSEMLGISLDPEISIQPFNDYISIRGVIELRGEYVKTTSQTGDDDDLELDDFHAKRYVEWVTDSETGETEFSHRFPVEISVPTYRVGDLDDVSVSIDSFDYELPNQSQLKFISTINIHGISEQDESPRDEEQIEEANNEQSFSGRQEEETFTFDLKDENELEMPVKPDVLEVPDNPTLSAELDTEKSPEKDRWKKEKTQSFAEFFSKNPEPESSQMESSYVESIDLSPDIVVDESHDVFESDESRSEEVVEDVRYLSDMFRDDEEHFSKMRVCIVQQKDTLESIAERYQIATIQLVKQNRLTDENISEGQILYIPLKNK